MRTANFWAIAAILAGPAVASARPDSPPPGIMKADVLVRVAHDGRADSVDAARASRPEPTSRIARPDSNLGQERHVALPIKSEIVQRVSLGDGRESAKAGPAQRASGAAGGQADRGYAHHAGHVALPIKSEISLRVSLGDGREASPPGALSRTTGVASVFRPLVYPDRYGQYGRHPYQSALAVKLPGWMQAQLDAGAAHVDFDDPKIDRQGIWAAGRRNQERRPPAQKQ
jgi:hypothetical protein